MEGKYLMTYIVLVDFSFKFFTAANMLSLAAAAAINNV